MTIQHDHDEMEAINQEFKIFLKVKIHVHFTSFFTVHQPSCQVHAKILHFIKALTSYNLRGAAFLQPTILFPGGGGARVDKRYGRDECKKNNDVLDFRLSC